MEEINVECNPEYLDYWDWLINAPYTDADKEYYRNQVKSLTGKYPEELDEHVDDLPF